MADLDSILPSIKVYPFPNPSNVHRNQNVYRAAIAECPNCLFHGDLYNVSKEMDFELGFCPGNQPPEVECNSPFMGQHTHQVSCAGISEPHFHVACQCCGSKFFLSIPEKR